MADIDEKTQKVIDKAVKTAKKEQLTAVIDAIKVHAETAKEQSGEGKIKPALTAMIRDVMRDVKAAAAE